MTNDEVKLLLRAYRAGGEDAHDPRFREALDQVQRDPALARWFADEQAATEIIARKIKAATPVPSDLQQTILAARNVIKPRAWTEHLWSYAAVLVATAIIAFTLGVFWARRNSPTSASVARSRIVSFETAMVEQARLRTGHVALETNDLRAIRGWLSIHQGDSAVSLPRGLAGRGPAGCNVISWNGRSVSFICFLKNSEPHVDLFVVTDTVLARGASRTPRSTTFGERNTLLWREGDRVFLMASRQPESQLRKLL